MISGFLNFLWSCIHWALDEADYWVRFWLKSMFLALLCLVGLLVVWAAVGSFVNLPLLNIIFAVIMVLMVSVLMIIAFPALWIGGYLSDRYPSIKNTFRVMALIITQVCLFGIIVSGLSKDGFANYMFVLLLFLGCILVGVIIWIPVQKWGWFHFIRVGVVALFLVVRFGYQERLNSYIETIRIQDVRGSMEIEHKSATKPREVPLVSFTENTEFFISGFSPKDNRSFKVPKYVYSVCDGRVHVYENPGFPETDSYCGVTLKLASGEEDRGFIIIAADQARKKEKEQQEEQGAKPSARTLNSGPTVSIPITPRLKEPPPKNEIQECRKPVFQEELDPQKRSGWPVIDLEAGNYQVEVMGTVCSFELESASICVGPEGTNYRPGKAMRDKVPAPDSRFLSLLASLPGKEITVGRNARINIPREGARLKFELNIPSDSQMYFTKDGGGGTLWVTIRKEPAGVAETGGELK